MNLRIQVDQFLSVSRTALNTAFQFSCETSWFSGGWILFNNEVTTERVEMFLVVKESR